MRFLTILIFFLSPLSFLEAKDFGAHGHVFEIEEVSLLDLIASKLEGLEASGRMEAHQLKLADKARFAAFNPKTVRGLVRAERTESRLFDPSITVPFDLKTHEGEIFARKGERMNPLDILPFPGKLMILDGRDEAQLLWLNERLQDENAEGSTILLTGGQPFALQKQLGREVYFDQGGDITKRFGIKSLPSLIRQEGSQLLIESFAIDEEGRRL